MSLRKSVASLTLLALGTVLLTGCDNQAARFGMPHPLSKQGGPILHLWQGAWIAALITGAITWALIFYAIWAYRRRSESDVPVQTRYNLPLEIFYTIAPVLMVIVFFAHTVRAQDAVLSDPGTDNVVEVTGQQWSWTFNYGIGALSYNDKGKDAAKIDEAIANKEWDDKTPFAWDYKSYAYDAGTGSHIPVLVVPVNETTRFNLHSPDVIHDFGITDFLEKMDVVPGRVNHYWVTPTTVTASFDGGVDGFLKPANGYNNVENSKKYFLRNGACYELCGIYHSRMLFQVAVVSQADYKAYVAQLDKRNHAVEPLIGGANAYQQAGLGETE